MNQKTLSLIFLSVASVSFASIFIRLSSAPPLIISFYRMFFSSLLVLLYGLSKGNLRLQINNLRKEDVFPLGLAGLFLSIHFALWVTSLNLTSVASSVILVATQPLFIVLIESVFLDKKPSKDFSLGLIAAAFGGFLIGFGNLRIEEFALRGDLFALLAAAMAAGYFLIGGEVRKRINILPYILIVYSVSSGFLLIFCFIARLPILDYSKYNFMLFLLLALIPTLIGHTVFNWLLSKVKASLIGVTVLGEPIGASVLAIIFFNEYPSRWVLTGGLFVLFSAYFLWKKQLHEF